MFLTVSFYLEGTVVMRISGNILPYTKYIKFSDGTNTAHTYIKPPYACLFPSTWPSMHIAFRYNMFFFSLSNRLSS